MPIPKLVAHRGFMHRYPENSRRGLHAALEAGACFIEFDVQMNADEEFIVIHDDNFERTAGLQQSVFSTTSKDCLAISVHEQSRFGLQFYPEPVASLTDILELISNHPEATALVEIKEESLQYWGLVTVMDKLLTVLNTYARQCTLISFDDAAIEYTRQHSKLATGWVLHQYDQTHYHRALQLQADILMCNYKKIPPDESPWREFRRWMLYDITSPELAIRYGKQGIELIETADIGGMLQNPVLKKMACLHGV